MTMETFNNKAAPEDNRIENSGGGPRTMDGRLTCDTERIIIGRVNCAPVADDRPLGMVNNSATLLFSALFRGWTRDVKGDHRLSGAKLSVAVCFLTRRL